MLKSGNPIGNKKIIVIAGPTASGKTSLAVSLATHLKCSIISADSRQFYKELSIGTAKPTSDEMQGIPHYFVNSHSVEKPLSSGQFEIESRKLVAQLFEKEDVLIVVGGSGMFIDALLYGTDQIPHSPKARAHWNQEFEHHGIAKLQEHLQTIDPDFYKEVDIYNPARLIRAIEVFESTGIPFSFWRKNTEKKALYPLFYFVIDLPREVLYNRINQRVDEMIQKGLLEEVKENMKFRHLQSLNTVGYKELFDYLDNKKTLEEAINLIKQNTRNYAKRQLTWFRKNKDAIYLNATSIDEQLKTILTSI